jgi:hypothetical protein
LLITVKEARQLPVQFSDSYIKLYLSEDGKDISDSKRKTEPHKGTTNPVFEEKFEFKLPANTKLSQQNRVQVTVWNQGGKLSTNDCLGGTSFSFEDIAQAGSEGLAGWFELFNEKAGRTRCQDVKEPEALIAAHASFSVTGSTHSLHTPKPGLISHPVGLSRSTTRPHSLGDPTSKQQALHDTSSALQSATTDAAQANSGPKESLLTSTKVRQRREQAHQHQPTTQQQQQPLITDTEAMSSTSLRRVSIVDLELKLQELASRCTLAERTVTEQRQRIEELEDTLRRLSLERDEARTTATQQANQIRILEDSEANFANVLNSVVSKLMHT